MAKLVGRAWGNALGGFRSQRRVKGKFASGFVGSSGAKSAATSLTSGQRRAQYLRKQKRSKQKRQAAAIASAVTVAGVAGYAGYRYSKSRGATGSSGSPGSVSKVTAPRALSSGKASATIGSGKKREIPGKLKTGVKTSTVTVGTAALREHIAQSQKRKRKIDQEGVGERTGPAPTVARTRSLAEISETPAQRQLTAGGKAVNDPRPDGRQKIDAKIAAKNGAEVQNIAAVKDRKPTKVMEEEEFYDPQSELGDMVFGKSTKFVERGTGNGKHVPKAASPGNGKAVEMTSAVGMAQGSGRRHAGGKGRRVSATFESTPEGHTRVNLASVASDSESLSKALEFNAMKMTPEEFYTHNRINRKKAKAQRKAAAAAKPKSAAKHQKRHKKLTPAERRRLRAQRAETAYRERKRKQKQVGRAKTQATYTGMNDYKMVPGKVNVGSGHGKTATAGVMMPLKSQDKGRQEVIDMWEKILDMPAIGNGSDTTVTQEAGRGGPIYVPFGTEVENIWRAVPKSRPQRKPKRGDD